MGIKTTNDNITNTPNATIDTQKQGANIFEKSINAVGNAVTDFIYPKPLSSKYPQKITPARLKEIKAENKSRLEKAEKLRMQADKMRAYGEFSQEQKVRQEISKLASEIVSSSLQTIPNRGIARGRN